MSLFKTSEELTNPHTTIKSTYITEHIDDDLNLNEEEIKIIEEDEDIKRRRALIAAGGFSLHSSGNKNRNSPSSGSMGPGSGPGSGIDGENENQDGNEKSKNSPSNKIVKIKKKVEDSLAGKYVRIGSGAYVGKLGRAVSRTVGNIYSISVLNVPDEKLGRHTSVTASKLQLIDENENMCTEEEMKAIQNDKDLLQSRILRKEHSSQQQLQNILDEKDRKAAKQALMNSNSENSNENENGSDNDEDDNESHGLIPKTALDEYVRVSTGRYEGLLARVTSLVGKYRCSVKVVEEIGVHAYRGTTITSTNYHPIIIENCTDEEKVLIENDKQIRLNGGHFSSSSGVKEKLPKTVFDVDLTGKYVRLMTGKYAGKIARVSTCPVGFSPCNVKVSTDSQECSCTAPLFISLLIVMHDTFSVFCYLFSSSLSFTDPLIFYLSFFQFSLSIGH